MTHPIDLNSLSVDELKDVIAAAGAAVASQRREHRREVVAKIRELAASAGLQVEIIGDAPIKRAPAAPKYRNPAAPDQTWSGRGKPPAWFREAMNSGVNVASMEIEAAAQDRRTPQ
jgi:DNA-binding protein H-NS